MFTRSRMIPLPVVILVCFGFAQTPHIYTMQPLALENLRLHCRAGISHGDWLGAVVAIAVLAWMQQGTVNTSKEEQA
jgi:hypothetical protein